MPTNKNSHLSERAFLSRRNTHSTYIYIVVFCTRTLFQHWRDCCARSKIFISKINFIFKCGLNYWIWNFVQVYKKGEFLLYTHIYTRGAPHQPQRDSKGFQFCRWDILSSPPHRKRKPLMFIAFGPLSRTNFAKVLSSGWRGGGKKKCIYLSSKGKFMNLSNCIILRARSKCICYIAAVTLGRHHQEHQRQLFRVRSVE